MRDLVCLVQREFSMAKSTVKNTFLADLVRILPFKCLRDLSNANGD